MEKKTLFGRAFIQNKENDELRFSTLGRGVSLQADV